MQMQMQGIKLKVGVNPYLHKTVLFICAYIHSLKRKEGRKKGRKKQTSREMNKLPIPPSSLQSSSVQFGSVQFN